MAGAIRSWARGVSLASKITWVIVVVVTIGFVITGVGTSNVLRDTLVSNVDRQLEDALSTFTGPKIGDDAVNCNFDQRVPNTYYLAVVDSKGTLLCDNKQPNDIYPEVSLVTLDKVASVDSAFTLPAVNDSYSWRVVATPIAVSSTGTATQASYVTLLIGVAMTDIERTMVAFLLIFTGFGILSLVLGAGITRLLVVTALRGLRRVSTGAERFADGDYSTRIRAEDPRTEVGTLGHSLNTMLDRIDKAIEERDASVQQMRRFIGDASHELRTPLVSVRGYAELYRMGAITNPQDVASAMDRIEKEAKRMGTLVEDLLVLARLDERRPLRLEPVDLVPLVNDAASDSRASSMERTFTVIPLFASRRYRPEPQSDAFGQQSFGHHGNGPAPEPVFTPAPTTRPAVVMGDENGLRQVIANLIGNACRYTPEGSPIELGIGVDTHTDLAHIHIIDHGEGVPVQMREQVFQRFFRMDRSRARETGGSGLGLSIVQGILEAHGGNIDIAETHGGGATFRITLPLADDSQLLALSNRIRPEHSTTSRSRSQPPYAGPDDITVPL
ncbi:sensor histidine kinase [Humidisolicoccus flavus]|uniref:sensor histidine kinase n=1 Tax=Humidisolicoccus flavus TaxID=3111414 RepID=UPI0032516561